MFGNLAFVFDILEYFVHQDSVVARSQLYLLPFVEIALGGEFEFQFRVGAAARVDGDPGRCNRWNGFPVGLSEFIPLTPVESRAEAFQFTDPDRVVGRMFERRGDQSPDRVGLPAAVEHQVQLLFCPCGCYVEHIDIVDVGEYRFPVKGLREIGYPHLVFVTDGHLTQCVERCFVGSGPKQRTALGREFPRTVRDDYRFVLQSLGFVDRDDCDGPAVLRQVDRLGSSCFLPSFDKKRQVRDF